MVAFFIIRSKKCNNCNILYLFTHIVALLGIIERKKWNWKIKKMCRAQDKSRAREDQNHIFFTSPYHHVHLSSYSLARSTLFR